MADWTRGTRNAFLVLAMTSLALVFPTVTSAAVAFRISIDPTEPRVGQAVTVTVATFMPGSNAAGEEPLPLEDFPWTFIARSPEGARSVIDLSPIGDSRNKWSGEFVFEEVGRWQIGLDAQHLGITPDPAMGGRMDVVVAEDDAPASLALAMGILICAFVVGGFVLTRRLTR